MARDQIDPKVLQQAASIEPAVILVSGRRHFEREVLESNLPVVVDFWAPWCQPCLRMGEALVSLAPLYAGKLKFVKVNLMTNEWAKEEFEIEGIPLLLLFMHGALIEDAGLLGAVPRREIVKYLDRLLAI